MIRKSIFRIDEWTSKQVITTISINLSTRLLVNLSTRHSPLQRYALHVTFLVMVICWGEGERKFIIIYNIL